MRLRPQAQPLLLVCLAAVMLGLGGIGWLARDRSSQGGQRPSRSLLELLEDIGKPSPPPQQGPGGSSPAPPDHAAWRSPLAQSCQAQPGERQRLLALVSQLRQSPTRVRIDPSNYGERHSRDAFGNPLDPNPRLVVLHETVYGIQSAINTFRTPHPRDDDQVSYHALVALDGGVVFLLDPSKRAFGAGNSAFRGEWAVTNARVQGSVNNFALHVSLETPLDGEHAGARHSGYTAAQYDALAALLALWMQTYPITPDQIVTHRGVDLGGERADPRSFDWGALQQRLSSLGLLC